MAASVVQTAGANSGTYTDTVSVSFGSNTTSGNLIVVVIGIDQSDEDVLTVTDTQSNTYTRIHTAAGTSNGVEYFMYYAYNITGGATTITADLATGVFQDIAIIAREYSGIATTDPLDKNVAAAGASYLISHSSGNTTTTADANELVVGAMGSDSQTVTYTAGSGYGNLTKQGGSDLYMSIAIEDKNVTATGTQAATFSTSAYVKGPVGVATFKLSGGGTLSINKSESVTVTESVSVGLRQLTKSVSDTVTTTESVGIKIPVLKLSVSDTITATESVSAFAAAVGGTSIFTTNVVTISESTAVTVQSPTTRLVSVSDSTTVTESLSVKILTAHSATETVTTSESVSVQSISPDARVLSVSDGVGVSESVDTQITTRIAVSDSTTLSESIGVVIPDETIITSDTVSVAESVQLTIPTLHISVSDTVTATESRSIFVPPIGTTSVFGNDTISVSESVGVFIANYAVGVSDTATVSDPIGITSVLSVRRFNAQSEFVTTTESVQLFIPEQFVAASELVLTSERVFVQKASGAGSFETLTVELEASDTSLALDAGSPNITINSTSGELALSAGSNSVILEA